MRVIAFLDGEMGLYADKVLREHPDVDLVARHPGKIVPSDVDWIQSLKPDIGISAGYRHLFARDDIALFPKGIVNVHTSLLPTGRGAHPNAWALYEGLHLTGVTLHQVDEGVDTGPILAHELVHILPWDDAHSLQQRLLRAARDLLIATIPRIPVIKPKDQGVGQRGRRKAEFAEMDEIDLDAATTARDVLNHLRARTYPGCEPAHFWTGERKVYVSLSLRPE